MISHAIVQTGSERSGVKHEIPHRPWSRSCELSNIHSVITSCQLNASAAQLSCRYLMCYDHVWVSEASADCTSPTVGHLLRVWTLRFITQCFRLLRPAWKLKRVSLETLSGRLVRCTRVWTCKVWFYTVASKMHETTLLYFPPAAFLTCLWNLMDFSCCYENDFWKKWDLI